MIELFYQDLSSVLWCSFVKKILKISKAKSKDYLFFFRKKENSAIKIRETVKKVLIITRSRVNPSSENLKVSKLNKIRW